MPDFSTIIPVLLRLLIVASVFDIYFKSPLIQVSEPPSLEFSAPARRVVLFVADGLRARSFYAPGAAPFLHHVGHEQGVLGISHTQIPTESRPGHVALLAGFYEDPSAITRGWTENPVEFDSVLNRSTNSWSWGSPDILNMFKKTNSKNINIHTYGAELEDFSSKDSSYLDSWVFDKVESFFKSATEDSELQVKLRKNGNVFFMHLLGCDTNGHTNKPESYEYNNNIKVVDDGIKKTVEVINNYFRNDGRTTFIFTADHGMTDWGSHGTGMDDETLTPFIAWGAGIKVFKNITETEIFDLIQNFEEFTGSLYKVDVRQADIAPLMSILAGINIPTNSIGMLPFSILDLHPKHIAEALKIQYDQLLAQYTKLLGDHENIYLSEIFHKDFQEMNRKRMTECEAIIKHQTKFGHYNESITMSMGCISSVYRGIAYYQRYHKTTLKFLISCTLVFSILADFLIVNNMLCSSEKYTRIIRNKNRISLVEIILICVMMISWFCQKLPLHFLLYYLAPCYSINRLKKSWQADGLCFNDLQLLALATLAVIVCEIIVTAFFERRALTLGVVVLAFTMTKKNYTHLFLLALLGLFSWLPPIDGRMQITELVVVASVLNSMAVYFQFERKEDKPIKMVFICMSLVSSFCVYYTSKVHGLNPLVQLSVWTIFITSIPVLVFLTTDLKIRVISVICSLQIMYSLLSLSYESLFLFALSQFIFCWLKEDSRNVSPIYSELKPSSTRGMYNREDVITFTRFFFLVFYSFFGTGNIASLNSFDPSSIRCFVAVFNPFLMGGLLLIKVLIPIFMFSITYAHLVQINRSEAKLVQSLLHLFTDFLSLHFFHFVQDSGSWLDIGSSLSHFIIVEGTSLFLSLLLHLSKFLINVNISSKQSSD